MIDSYQDTAPPPVQSPSSAGIAVTVPAPPRAAEARDAAAAFAESLHPAPSPRTVQNLLLLVSELVTNALRHAGAVLELRLSAAPGCLRIAVDDPSPVHPQPRSPDWTGGTGGFGWPMVQRLAGTLTVRPNDHGGKTVLVTLSR